MASASSCFKHPLSLLAAHSPPFARDIGAGARLVAFAGAALRSNLNPVSANPLTFQRWTSSSLYTRSSRAATPARRDRHQNGVDHWPTCKRRDLHALHATVLHPQGRLLEYGYYHGAVWQRRRSRSWRAPNWQQNGRFRAVPTTSDSGRLGACGVYSWPIVQSGAPRSSLG